jgi:hypothetical protein
MQRKITALLTLAGGLGMALSFLLGFFPVQGGVDVSVKTVEVSEPSLDFELETCWLILDPALPQDELLLELLHNLKVLQGNGDVIRFDRIPKSSSPSAVKGLRVTALSNAWWKLGYLPGVLDISATLPQPPAVVSSNEIQTSGILMGEVTDSGTGLPVPFVLIRVYDADSYSLIGEAVSDINGNFNIAVYAPFDEVKVKFYDIHQPMRYIHEWYTDQRYFSTADSINLPEGGLITNVNAALERGGVVEGVVTYEDSGIPAETILYFYGTDGSNWGNKLNNLAGEYSIRLAPASYNLYLSGRYAVNEWYMDADSQAGAEIITVTEGSTQTLNIQLNSGGWITGTVTDEHTGLPIMPFDFNRASVLAVDTTGSIASNSVTDEMGDYKIGGLATGRYKVWFIDYLDYYQTEFYDSEEEIELATSIDVTEGMTTANINASLLPLNSFGTITGTIKEITFLWPNPLDLDEDVVISFHDAETGESSLWYYFTGDGMTTDYRVQLPEGRYKVLFTQKHDQPIYSPEWYDNQILYQDASVVTVTASMTTPGIDALLAVPWLPTARGCIDGVVTKTSDGTELPSVDVIVYPSYGDFGHTTKTNHVGTYKICGLLGNYEVYFEKSPFFPEWHQDVKTRDDATVVNVTAGVTETVDTSLHLGGCVSGMVTDLDGRMVSRTGLHIYDSSGDRVEFFSRDFWTSYGSTRDDATFTLCGLDTGVYILECMSDYLDDFVPISVEAGQITTGVSCVVANRLYLPLVIDAE